MTDAVAQDSLFRPPPRRLTLRVGPAGWNYKDWDGIVYPASAGRAFDPLAYLADYFDTIEINSSFYRTPRPADAAAWARRVRNNPRFRFTAKAWQRLTHEREELDAPAFDAACRDVRASLAPLAEAGVLGAVLVQFPWRFRFGVESAEYVARIARGLAPLPLVVEVRHGSWSREECRALLRELRVGFCNVDQPVIGESLAPSAWVTSAVGYFRLHGRNYRTWFQEDAGRDARYDYLYTPREVAQLSGLIETIAGEADETYAIANNHFRGQAIANALDILTRLAPEPPAIPPTLAAAFPHLVTVA